MEEAAPGSIVSEPSAQRKRRSITSRFFGIVRRNPRTLKSALRLELRRHVWQYLDKRINPRKALRPAFLSVNLTRRCNLKCEMCQQQRRRVGLGVELPWYRTNRELPLAAWIDLLEQVKNYSPWVALIGGEPLLYPHFRGLVTGAKQRGFPVDITTNGTLLAAFADFIVEQGIEVVAVSLDGPEDVHDQIRGQKGAFRRTIAGIAALAEARRCLKKPGPIIVINCVIMKDNLPYLDQMVRLAVNLDADLVQFIHPAFDHRTNVEKHNVMFSPEWTAGQGLNVIHPSVSEGEYFDYNLTPEDVSAIKVSLERARREADGQLKVGCLPGLAGQEIDPYYLDLAYPFSQICNSLWTKCRIQPDGTVEPCLHVVAGNIRDTPLLEIWNGPQYGRLREIMSKGLLPACVRCCHRAFVTHQRIV